MKTINLTRFVLLVLLMLSAQIIFAQKTDKEIPPIIYLSPEQFKEFAKHNKVYEVPRGAPPNQPIPFYRFEGSKVIYLGTICGPVDSNPNNPENIKKIREKIMSESRTRNSYYRDSSNPYKLSLYPFGDYTNSAHSVCGIVPYFDFKPENFYGLGIGNNQVSHGFYGIGIGYNKAVDFWGIGLGVQNASRSLNGINVGLVNFSAGDINGINVGFSNQSKGDVIGICIGDPFIAPLALLYFSSENKIKYTISNFGNHIEGNLFGISVSHYNSIKGAHVGASIGIINDASGLLGAHAGLYNLANDGCLGFQIGGLNEVNDACYGMQVGLYNEAHRNQYGMQVGLISLVGGNQYAIQGGLWNVVRKNQYGMQGGLISLVGGNQYGMQVDLWNYVRGNQYGLQVGLYNEAHRDLHGMQIGLWNKVRGNLYGMQIGLWNECAQGPLPLINIRF